VRLRILALFLLASAAFGQSDRATITGSVADPAGAVVANAPIAARNTETGAIYQGATSATGNYTLSQLPAGSYELTVTVPGFKKYVRQNIVVQVAQTLRLDVALEVGSAAESVTVTAETSLLKTESGELSHNVQTSTLNNLPILGIGQSFAGSAGIRNPQAVAFMLPGAYVQPNSNVRINGAPGNTASYRIEGQDASNGQVPATQAQVQPSIDSIQEVTIQTSNFAAEYGQVGGGFFNYTMKSGTNQLHASAYDYFVNEAFNANTPWLNTKSVARRNDYGFTVGAPVVIPKVYNGHDKTFFFFNWEQFREKINVNNQTILVPIQAYRDGNFQPAMTGRTLSTDVLGRPIMENTIYDPLSTNVLTTGQRVRDPFVNNTIPAKQMDPVSLKVQSLIPAPTRPGLVSNAIYPYISDRITDIPAFKVDHSLSSKAKLSYFWQQTRTKSQYSQTFGGSDGLPTPITAAIGTFTWSPTQRLNLDYTLTPTMLLHFGVGYQRDYFTDDAPVLDYNAETSLGLKGATVNRLFPNFVFPATQAQGGMKNMGPGTNRHPLLYEKPTANTSLTYVRNNHTYKLGGELRLDSNQSTIYAYTNGIYTFSANQTALPYLQTTTVGGGTIGFPYASFLLGGPDSVRIAPPDTIRLGKHQIGLFVQDTWKVTRKLTLDYGLRWDYSTYLKEQYGRLAQFSPTTPNPSQGGMPGAVIFEGDGPGRCNCTFANIYPFAIGPRIGFAYQLNPKTVVRGGWGVVYTGTGDSNGASQGGLTAPQAVNSPAFGDPVINLQTGIPSDLVLPFPNFDPGQYPQKGYATTQAPLVWYDQNAGRPARQVQWSVSVQREIGKDFVVEAAYVGNRGAWWYSPSLIDVNGLTPERLKLFGLDINNAGDQAILKAPLNSANAGAFRNKVPYTGFPTTATVAQSLRPFPQFSSITSLWSPLGRTWYDSMQLKGTKRISHGLAFTTVFTWQKNLLMGAPSNPVVPGTGGGATNDVFNRSQNKYLSAFDQPLAFNIALNYTVPAARLGDGLAAKSASWFLRDWTANTLLAYASGLPIQAPLAQNTLNTLLLRNVPTLSNANRVPGQPLFTQDLNCHCYDPAKAFVLNPAAWSDPAPGQWGTSAAYYSDYRFQRRPNETMSMGRIFRIKERTTLNLRIEFSNVFNRAQIPNPTSTNAKQTQTCVGGTCQPGSATSAGFGFINTAAVTATTSTGTPSSRQGTMVARITF
jgi:hypothetical protein